MDAIGGSSFSITTYNFGLQNQTIYTVDQTPRIQFDEEDSDSLIFTHDIVI